MRIMYLSAVYPKPHAPSRGVFNRSLCQALAERHEVHVVSPTPWTERATRRPTRSRTGGNRISESHPTWYFPPRLWRSRADSFMWASIGATVQRIGAEFRPDCVLSYWAHPDGAVAARAARLWGVPAGVIVGGTDILILPRDAARRRAIVRALETLDAIFVVGEALREATIRLGIDPRKIHIHRQGIDRRRFRPGDRSAARRRLGMSATDSVLLWVGRMVQVKALDVLVAACARLRARGREIRLVLVGDGPLRSQVVADCARQGLADSVTFAGEVTHDNLPDWYRAADLFVLSSWSEGVPNVLREALACGTPYAATNVGGVAEVTDDPAVVLVPSGDPTNLADAIDGALASRRRPDPARAQFRDWSEAGERLLDVLVPTRAVRETPACQLESCP